MIEQQQQRKPYFKQIPPDPELSKLKKDSWAYGRRQRQLRCCMCANVATKMLVYQLEGCKRLERYCDGCALSCNVTNIS